MISLGEASMLLTSALLDSWGSGVDTTSRGFATIGVQVAERLLEVDRTHNLIDESASGYREANMVEAQPQRDGLLSSIVYHTQTCLWRANTKRGTV